jgi:hypothetical protein
MNDNKEELLRLGQYPCTKKQMSIVRRVGKDGVEIFQKLVWLAIEAHDSWEKLPHVNENGERVVHGANRMMHQIEQMYYLAAQSLVLGIPEKVGRDWFPWMYIRNMVARHNDLPGWMQWLIDKNDGKIPTEWSHDDMKTDDEIGKERLAAKVKAGTSATFDLGRDE